MQVLAIVVLKWKWLVKQVASGRHHVELGSNQLAQAHPSTASEEW